MTTNADYGAGRHRFVLPMRCAACGRLVMRWAHLAACRVSLNDGSEA